MNVGPEIQYPEKTNLKASHHCITILERSIGLWKWLSKEIPILDQEKVGEWRQIRVRIQACMHRQEQILRRDYPTTKGKGEMQSQKIGTRTLFRCERIQGGPTCAGHEGVC